MSDTDQPNTSSSLADRVQRLESESVVLRAIVAHLVAGAAPQARVAIVRMLTGSPSKIAPTLARTIGHEEIMTALQRELMGMIAASAG